MDFLNRLQRFRIFSHSYTDPSLFFKSLIVFPNKMCGLMGLDVFTEGYKTLNWFVLGSFVMAAIYFYTSAITVRDVYDNPEELIFCLVTIGIGIQGVGKIYTYLRFSNQLVSIFQYTETLYKQKFSQHEEKLIMKSVFILSVIVKVMLVAYAFTSSLMLVAPILYTIQTGEKILPFGFYLPYFDRLTWGGYCANFVLHIFCTLITSSEDMGPDCIYMITMVSAFTQIDLIISALRDLDRAINSEDEIADDYLRCAINRYQEHLQYLRIVETIYRFNFLVTFVSLSLTLILALFAVVTLSWFQGYVFIAFISYELFFGSFLGTLLAMKNDQLQREIYNIAWYKLSISNQKSLRFLLQSAQEPVCLTLIFAPLNMPTFLQVYKTIYSMFTMLLTVRDE